MPFDLTIDTDSTNGEADRPLSPVQPAMACEAFAWPLTPEQFSVTVFNNIS